jgi:hypothetical protein
MKKQQIVFDKKLSLDRSIISKLNASQMDIIAGGSVNTATCIDNLEDEMEKSCKACSCNSPTKY